MANEKVNSLITDLLKRAKQIESEDGESASKDGPYISLC